MKSTITITFGDVAENGVGMEKIGVKAKRGFSKDEMDAAEVILRERGYKCERIDLSEELLQNKKIGTKLIETSGARNASILIIRNGVNKLLNKEDAANLLLEEQKSLQWDKKEFMKGSVKNLKARYKLCYGSVNREPDYEKKQGRIVSFESVPLLSQIRDLLPLILGDSARELNAEGNFYYDVSKTAIGFHGDGERRKVVAVRLGESFPLHYQWHYKGECVGKRMTFQLNHGDIYVMSEKSVGTDWLKKNTLTLRHAAGTCEEYVKQKKKKKKEKKVVTKKRSREEESE